MTCESKTLLTGRKRQGKVRQDLHEESASITLSAGPPVTVFLLPVEEAHIHEKITWLTPLPQSKNFSPYWFKILDLIPRIRDINSYSFVIDIWSTLFFSTTLHSDIAPSDPSSSYFFCQLSLAFSHFPSCLLFLLLQHIKFIFVTFLLYSLFLLCIVIIRTQDIWIQCPLLVMDTT